MIGREVLRAIVAIWIATAQPATPHSVATLIDIESYGAMDTIKELVHTGMAMYVGDYDPDRDSVYDQRSVKPTILGVKEAIS